MKVAQKVIGLLLCVIVAISTIPMFAHAAWEDGMECWFCDHYHWDEYCCGMCGACSIDCTDVLCFASTHCNECGACGTETVFCLECMACENCYVNEGWHCLGCGECHVDSQEELCGFCWFCADCMGGLCDGCGFCEGCWEIENMHCLECGNCYGSYDICQYGYIHCEECCVICEQCEECLYEDGIEPCDDCGLCVFCCQNNAASEGCSCGEYCIENPEWYEHLCPDCGNAYCEVDMCEDCELCLDCCEGNSECSEVPPICVENDEYEFHFCEDCGDCFHNSAICESCEAAGTLLCENCCEIRLEKEGCDCSDRCISDSDLDEHIASAHANADGSHTATPQSGWEISDTHHWRACRFCGESAHISNKAAHTYDKYGICTVCNFDSQQVILILKQPQSVVAKVSDIQTALEDDPLYPTNNKRTFTVAAKGTSALTYQWYVTYGNGQWFILQNNSQGYDSVSGANTNTLTVSVPIDGCAYNHAYKCVITDANSNEVTSNTAYLKTQHVYRKYSAHKGELIGIINQNNAANNIGMYASNGHYMTCVGEECEASKLEPHSYGKQYRMVYDSKNGIHWIERTCIHCGFKGYTEDHIHYFYDPETYECEVDTSYKNANQHRLKCLWPGCDKTKLETHEKMGWQNHGTPYSTADKVGIAYQECHICGYSSTKKLQTYNESKGEMVDAKWTQSTDLVYVDNGYASCDVVVNGTKVIIGFAPSEYAKKEFLKMKYPTVTGWKVRYYCDQGSSGNKVDMDVTKYFTFEKIGEELRWKVTIPSFAGRTGGGVLTFTPTVAECKHTAGTRVINASQPICTTDGYTGDTVCAGCEGVIRYGEVIESAGKHEGKLTLIAGTSKKGTCESRGYEGTYRCDHCNKTVRGKSTSKQHSGKTVLKNAVAFTCTEFGYSGDVYCECGVLLQEGQITAPRHTDLRLINANNSSCQKRGYTGDWKCYDCNQIVKYGYNVAQGDHAWSKYGKVDDIYHRHTCVVAGCGAAELSKHTDANRDLTCDGCGYSWGDYSWQIRDIVFNIDVPAIGAKPDYTGFNGEYFNSEGVGANEKNGIIWFDVTDGKRFTPGGVNQEFREGHVYKVTINFRCNVDYEFASEEILTAAINGREAKVEYVTYGQFAGISYTFEALEHIHTLKRVNKVAAGCTKPGKQMYYHCDGCGKSYADAAGKTQISDLASWGVVAALDHVESGLKSNSTHHFKVCTRCHQEIAGTRAEHSGGTATCLNKAKCDVCGATYGKVAEHIFAQDAWGYFDAAGHAHLCTTLECGDRDKVIAHTSSGEATDDIDEFCVDCGYIITMAKNHKHSGIGPYQHDDEAHWQICGCGAECPHEPHVDKNRDGECDACSHDVAVSNSGSNLWWLWSVIAVVAVGGIVFFVIFAYKKKKEQQPT